MKRILFIALGFLMIGINVWAQPKITFEKDIQELGYVLWRNPVTIVYNFINTGKSPLVISNVTSSCGCTKLSWTKEPIPVNGKGEVSAIFDAEAIGHFYKEIGIYSNASAVPVYVKFNGEVTADAKNYSFTHPFAFGAIRLDKEEIVLADIEGKITLIYQDKDLGQTPISGCISYSGPWKCKFLCGTPDTVHPPTGADTCFR